MGKSATIGDLRQRQVAVRQEPPCPVDAPPKDELMGGQAGGQLELADEMGNAEAADQAQFLKLDRPVQMGFHEILHAFQPSSRQSAIVLGGRGGGRRIIVRSEEHTSELQSLMRISYAVFCL